MPLPERHEPLKALLQRLMEEIGAAHFSKPPRLGDAAWVGYRLCELLPVTPERKQQMLEITDPLILLDRLTDLITVLREQP